MADRKLNLSGQGTWDEFEFDVCPYASDGHLTDDPSGGPCVHCWDRGLIVGDEPNVS